MGRGWTPRDGLYGIADQLIDLGLVLHGPIGILELSTFNLQLCMILIVSNSFFVPWLYKFFQTFRFRVVSPLVYDECHGFQR